MAMAISDFSHGTYAYTDDAGVARQVSMRNVYAPASGLTLAGSAFPQISVKAARRRYIYAIGAGTNNRTISRHYPIDISKVAAPGSGPTIDGVAFVLGGYRGEKDRKVG